MDDFIKIWLPMAVAVASLILNIIQWFGYRRVRNKISIWAKDSRSMVTSIIGIQKNIKNKKINSLNDVTTNMDTLSNFANSMFISMEEEMGNKKREIKIKKNKPAKPKDIFSIR